MTATEFGRRVMLLPKCVNSISQVESVRAGLPAGFNVFSYAAACEKCFELQLTEMTGRERISTFYADLSIGECFGLQGVLDTCKNACKHWKDNVEMMSEFSLCVNWKAWEHAGRNNEHWAKAYSALYYHIDSLLRDYYEADPDKASYYFQYMD